jgi:hypothetical protein
VTLDPSFTVVVMLTAAMLTGELHLDDIPRAQRAIGSGADDQPAFATAEFSEGDPADLAVTLDIAAGERFDVD